MIKALRLSLSPLNLAAHLVILVAAIAATDLGVHGVETLKRRAEERAQLANQTLVLARAHAIDIQNAFEAARQVLVVLAQSRSIVRHEAPRCSELLRDAVDALPMYAFISATDRDGTARCSSRPDLPLTSIHIDPWQHDTTIASNGLVVGFYSQARIAGEQVVRISLPIRDENGETIGALIAGIAVEWLNSSSLRAQPFGNAISIVADLHGTIIEASPERSSVGSEIPEALRPALTDQSDGTTEMRDDLGVTRVFAHVPLHLGRVGGVVVFIGLDRDAALAEIDRATMREVAAALLLFSLSGLLALAYVRWFVGRPIDALTAIAARWQAGDWTVRAKRSHRIAEIDALTLAFDRMAEAVASREASLAHAAAALRHSEQHLAQAQRVAGLGSFQWDIAQRELLWSDELYRIFGVDRASFQPSRDFVEAAVVEEDRPRIREAIASSLRGEVSSPIEFRIRRPDGTVRRLSREAEPVRDATGAVVTVIGIMRDVTELRAAEDQRDALEIQLRHAQKMEALGTLAGGIAHDFNNALVPILTMSSMLLNRGPSEERERQALTLIRKSAERARDLVRRILTFARKETPQREHVDLAALIDDALQLLRPSLPATITIERRLAPVPPIRADAGQLEQVLINLVTNAAYALGGRQGRVIVEVAPADTGKAVRLAVTDNGSGMDEATRQRIFEPFFTTKPIGEGTGLGLSVVHGIITAHGGIVTVESTPGAGTRIEIILTVGDTSDPDTSA